MPECSFLIPLQRDAEIADGKAHARSAWKWLHRELGLAFEAMTIAPGEYTGVWPSPLSKKNVSDKSKKYTIAIPRQRVQELRAILQKACVVFAQQSLYLSVAGNVEFIQAPDNQEEFHLP